MLKILIIASFLFNFLFSNCTKFELEDDERFKVLKIGDNYYLSVNSKDFNNDSLLFCENNSIVYDKILAQHASSKENALIFQSDILLDDLKIFTSSKSLTFKDISFTINDKKIFASLKNNTIHISKQYDQDDNIYKVVKKKKKTSTLPFNFSCNETYFRNSLKAEALVFQENDISVDIILNKLNKYNIQSVDNNNKKLASWYFNCSNYISSQKEKSLNELREIDKQIIIQSSIASKRTDKLFFALAQSSMMNSKVSNRYIIDFEESLNALKNLESQKSQSDFFNNIISIFYVQNNTNIKNKLNFILNYNKNENEYYNLLSNTQYGSFENNDDYKLDMEISKVVIYALDASRDFIMIEVYKKINLYDQNVQLATYKLSNGYCSRIDKSISVLNKSLSKKIPIIKYCTNKEYSTKPLNVQYQNNFASSGSSFVPAYNEQSSTQYETNNQEEPEEEVSTSKEVSCKTEETYMLCKNVTKNNINSYIKDGYHIPSYDSLEDKFDLEDLEGLTFYSNGDSYYYFNEDEGWQEINKVDKFINIYLILEK